MGVLQLRRPFLPDHGAPHKHTPKWVFRPKQLRCRGGGGYLCQGGHDRALYLLPLRPKHGKQEATGTRDDQREPPQLPRVTLKAPDDDPTRLTTPTLQFDCGFLVSLPAPSSQTEALGTRPC